MNVLNNIKKYLLSLLTYIPTRLPQGMAEFDVFVDSMIKIADFPTDSVDDIKFVVATLVMHLGPTAAYKPKRYFILAVKAGAAKQVASGVFQEIKYKQQAAAKAAQEKQQAEATANAAQVANEVLRNS